VAVAMQDVAELTGTDRSLPVIHIFAGTLQKYSMVRSSMIRSGRNVEN
jgi:hypothetical protein